MPELEFKAESFDPMFFLLVSISPRRKGGLRAGEVKVPVELDIGWAVKLGRVR